MVKNTALHSLEKLSSIKVDNAAITLGKATLTLENAQTKLVMLQGYLKEYEDQYANSIAKGVNMGVMENFQQFMLKMQLAVKGQQQTVEIEQKKMDAAKATWQLYQKEKLSYSVLIKRNDMKAGHIEQKREQKNTDEQALRTINYRK